MMRDWLLFLRVRAILVVVLGRLSIRYTDGSFSEAVKLVACVRLGEEWETQVSTNSGLGQ